MVKLNIEMSMASLIVRLAQGKEQDASPDKFDSSTGPSHSQSDPRLRKNPNTNQSFQLTSAKRGGTSKIHSRNDSDESLGQIHCRTDLNIVVEHVDNMKESEESSSRSSHEMPLSMFGDETPLHKTKNGVQITGKAL